MTYTSEGIVIGAESACTYKKKKKREYKRKKSFSFSRKKHQG